MRLVAFFVVFFANVICTLGYSAPASVNVPGAITYPIANATKYYTLEFVSISSTPSSDGPTCVACNTSNCLNPCASNANNPQNCCCSLSPNEYQWLNNMIAGENQSVAIVYNAKNAEGSIVGTFTLTIDTDFYSFPTIENDVGNDINFGVEYGYSPNNSSYSGPCWAVILGPI
jgi:hypothetical protein